MTPRYVRYICFTLCIVSGSAFAVSQALYPLASPAQSARFQHVVEKLRCLVCPNENLNDSEADFAVDLRRDIYQQIQQGASSREVIQQLVAQYGEFIRYKPSVTPATYVLWFAPFILLLVGCCVIGLVARRGRRD